MFFNPPTQVSPFCKKFFETIDRLCDAMRCLQSTEENKALKNDLEGIKTVLCYENDNDNAKSFLEAFEILIKKHQQVIALIPIILCFRNIVSVINPISTRINTLCVSSQELNESFKNFKQLLKNYEAPTEGEAKNVYDIFMARLSKNTSRKKTNESTEPHDDTRSQAGWKEASVHDVDIQSQAGWKEASVHDVDIQSQAGWHEQSKAHDADTQSQAGWSAEDEAKTRKDRIALWTATRTQDKHSDPESKADELTTEEKTIEQTKKLADQILKQFMMIAIILNKPEFHNVFNFPKKFNINEFIIAFIKKINNYKTSWLSIDPKNLQSKREEINIQTKQTISSIFDNMIVGMPLQSLVLFLIIKIDNESIWLKSLRSDLTQFSVYSTSEYSTWNKIYNSIQMNEKLDNAHFNIQSNHGHYTILNLIIRYDCNQLVQDFNKLLENKIQSSTEKTPLIEKTDDQPSCCSCCNIL
jgi:hypothetical protein